LWALDFACDALATGRGIRILAIVDAFTRECLTLEVDTSLSSQRVTRALEQVIEQRGKPYEDWLADTLVLSLLGVPRKTRNLPY
jgi:transposase InsO family protein